MTLEQWVEAHGKRRELAIARKLRKRPLATDIREGMTLLPLAQRRRIWEEYIEPLALPSNRPEWLRWVSGGPIAGLLRGLPLRSHLCSHRDLATRVGKLLTPPEAYVWRPPEEWARLARWARLSPENASRAGALRDFCESVTPVTRRIAVACLTEREVWDVLRRAGGSADTDPAWARAWARAWATGREFPWWPPRGVPWHRFDAALSEVLCAEAFQVREVAR